jgi:hypothetical protein
VRADAAELMDAGVRAHHHPVVDMDVTRELRVVRERGAVPHDAVVRDVRIGEEQIAVADSRVAAVLRGAGIDRHELAEDVVVADRRGGGLAGVFAVLRDVADRRELEQPVALADTRASGQHHVRTEDRAGIDANMGPTIE